MVYYDKVGLSEGIGLTESNNSKECIVFHYWYFNHGFRFLNSVCNNCHDLVMLSLNLSGIAIVTVKGIDFCYIIQDISKSDTICLLVLSVSVHVKEVNIKNKVYNHYFGNSIKAKKN